FALAKVMDRFGGGDLEARGDPIGPIEVREMARRFNAMADALEKQRETQRSFLASVAHDLRHPLGALKLATAVLRPGGGAVGEDRLKMVEPVVKRQIQRLERMVTDLLDTTSIEAGRLRLHLEVHDARRLIDETRELFEAAKADHPLAVLVPEAP